MRVAPSAGMIFRHRPLELFGKVVVITGGSRGLGLELARVFAHEGAKVAICARDEDEVTRAVIELSARDGAQVMGAICDVTSSDEVVRFIKEVETAFGAVDVLVNNAGIMQTGPSEHMTSLDFEEALATHLAGPMNAIGAVLGSMKSRHEGHIVNICSIGGKIAVPHLLPYSVSKFALAGLSDGLGAELSKRGIHVTTVYPGLMRTGSPVRAMFKGRYKKEYAWFSVAASLPIFSLGSMRAAQQIVDAVREGRAEVVLGAPAKLAVIARALAPNLTRRALAAVDRLMPKPGGIREAAMSGAESASAWSPSIFTILSQRAAIRNNEVVTPRVGAPEPSPSMPA
jgi:NAD(P)-dependent dehydrogenase (short-subunit alcohol dehydrogenase family)